MERSSYLKVFLLRTGYFLSLKKNWLVTNKYIYLKEWISRKKLDWEITIKIIIKFKKEWIRVWQQLCWELIELISLVC